MSLYYCWFELHIFDKGGCCNAFSGGKHRSNSFNEENETQNEGSSKPKYEKYITLGPDHCSK